MYREYNFERPPTLVLIRIFGLVRILVRPLPYPLPHTLKDDATSILKYTEKYIGTYKPL